MYLSTVIAVLFVGGIIAAVAAQILPRKLTLPAADLDLVTSISARRRRVLAVTATAATVVSTAFFIFGALPALALSGYVLFFLLPTLILGGVFIAVVVAEHVVTSPRDAERVASLVPRMGWSFTPAIPASLLVVAVALGAAVPLTGAYLGADNPTPGGGEFVPGQTLRYTCPDGVTGSTSPWPGSFYTPWLLGVLAITVLALAVVWVVVARRAAHPGMSPAADALLRTSTLRRTIAAATIVIGSQAAITAGVMTMDLQDISRVALCAADKFTGWATIVGGFGAVATTTALVSIFVFFQREKIIADHTTEANA